MIEQSYIDRIYARLTEMDVELDPDPIEFGPSRLNNKVSEVRTHLSNTEKIFMEVSHNLQKLKRELLVAQTEYTIEQTQLIANDPHVRSGRSQKEREALAATRLVHIQTRINEHTLSTHDLEDLMTVIKAKRTDLKDLQGRLRDQLKLCQEQIALGQRWGSKTYTAKSFESPSLVSDPEVNTARLVADYMTQREKVEDRLNESAEEELAKALSQTPAQDLKDTTSDVEQVLDALEKIPLDQIKTDVDDIDLDDLFEQFGG